ncbi:MAG: AAA family ATPase [Ramlibacter sp.]|nr:AAA family ATPase [Ramlibacter sp.]
MTILQEILGWSKNIPPWQSDAVARLLSKQALDEQDIDDLYALLKSLHGVADPLLRVAQPLSDDQIPVAVKNSTQVVLYAVKNLQNVNAIASNVRMPISPAGLTVIYGDNGSGKSGYSRVLKRACRARDQTEKILPNANLIQGNSAPPEAEFEVSVDGREIQTIRWRLGQPAPAELSALSIFDSRCARAYLDQENDFSYVPYGLDVFEGLVKTCRDLKARLDVEHLQHATDLTAFAGLHGDTTVGAAIEALGPRTDPKHIERLATLTHSEKARHAEIDKSLKENNPKERAAQVRALSQRVALVSTTVTTKADIVSDDAIQKLHALSDAYRTAKAAAEVAAKTFKEGERLLPETGGEVWRELFEAARKFSVQSHEGHVFPDLGKGSLCPLCQQPLEEGAERLMRFEKFIHEEAERTAQKSRKTLFAAYQPFIGYDLSISLDEVTYGEIEGAETGLGDAVGSFEKMLLGRQQAVKTAIEKNIWSDILHVAGPAARLKALAEKLAAQAQTLDKASDEKTREALTKEQAELGARIRLAEVKSAVLTAVHRLTHQARLTSCVASLRTNAITAKSAEIAEKVVSLELAKALNAEFKALGVGSLRVALKSRGDKGRALHKLKLELPQSASPGDILSEGEQRAIAIGAFLAEIGLGGGRGGIVFDDPVSSLDHRRREHVARRLIQEAGRRQVIVFTHDIYFLSILVDAANTSSTPITTQSLNKRAQGFGVAEADLPFEGASVKRRIGTLKAMHQDICRIFDSGDEPEHRRATAIAYFRLRMTWERAVEEVLLRNVVLRFRKGVETSRLAEVTVDDEDFKAVNHGMSKCSDYAHDKAMGGGVAMPDPVELLADIVGLDEWRSKTEERSKATRKARA